MKPNLSHRQETLFLAGLTKSKKFTLTGLLVVSIVCIYMWQWHAMPLFPDEVAIMMHKARSFYDGGVLYESFPICRSGEKQVPLLFYPAAAFLNAINSLSHWQLIRVVPFISIISLMAAVFSYVWKTGKSAVPLFLFAAVFLGVAGSGLILSRPETYLVLHGAACLFVYSYCIRNQLAEKTALALLILLGFVSNISFFIHPQGMIFAPLTLMLMYRISTLSFDGMVRRIAVASSVLYVGLSVWYGIKINHIFRCDESRAITGFIHGMTLPGWLKSSGASHLSNQLHGKYFVRYQYFDKFRFEPLFQINYLPPSNYHGLNPDFLYSINVAINLMAAVILLAFISLCVILMIKVCAGLYGLRRETSPWPIRLVNFAVSDEVMFFTICWAHLGLLIIVTQINFYRAFYLNLAMVVLLIIASQQVKNKLVGKAAEITAMVSPLLCIASTVIAGTYISPRLESGYAGPSIPLATNWRRVDEDVQTLEKRCGISAKDSGIVVDDMTYDALKKNNKVFAITYIGLGAEIMNKPVMSVIKETHATSAIARCSYFETFKIPRMAEMNGLCATNLKVKASVP
jgi:hypothetical protein